MKNNEIERRWLIPNNSIICGNPIKRRVAYIETNDIDTVIRFRQNSKDKYVLTIKQGGGISRIEDEVSITEDYFNEHTKDLFVMDYVYQKSTIDYGKHSSTEIEIKVVNNWTIIEKEFNSLDEAKNFLAPEEWMEVTDIGYFNMYNLYILEKNKKRY